MQTRTTIGWDRNNNTNTLLKIDRICAEYQCSRATAITKIVDRLNKVDSTWFNPLTTSPSILES